MHNDVTAHNKAIAFWLLTCCGLVFAMVVLGGITRLTGSGLSMVDWRPLLGWLPPLSDGEWQRVFEMYQQSPEFQKLNSQMDISAFRNIFWLEYLHRLLGRIIGIVFLLPFIYFLVRGYIRRTEWPKYLLMFVAFLSAKNGFWDATSTLMRVGWQNADTYSDGAAWTLNTDNNPNFITSAAWDNSLGTADFVVRLAF